MTNPEDAALREAIIVALSALGRRAAEEAAGNVGAGLALIALTHPRQEKEVRRILRKEVRSIAPPPLIREGVDLAFEMMKANLIWRALAEAPTTGAPN